jgi:Phosphotransferase enzyme family
MRRTIGLVEARLETPFPSSAVAEAVGAALVEWETVATRGYARSCAHWRAKLADGRRVFIKHALTTTAVEWLQTERVIYEAVREPFMPSFLGAYDNGELALIVLEDLSEAEWPPPWSRSGIESVLASLDALHRTVPPNEIGKLDAIRGEVVGWPDIAANPEPLLSTGLCAPTWLEKALPALVQASEAAQLDGTELLHFDVRSDNLCLRDGQALLFDWNLARVGNGVFDVAFWLPSLTLEGGPPPWEVLPNAGLLAAAVAGFFAVRAGLPPPPTAPTVRDFQRAQAEVALAWTARELELPPL